MFRLFSGRRVGGQDRVLYTYSKALDNVGEFFFSSPIDNFNIWQDYGRSDDDQRHRFVFDGTIHSPMGTANNLWERNTIQGSAARPTINGSFISRNAGTGFDFFRVPLNNWRACRPVYGKVSRVLHMYSIGSSDAARHWELGDF